VIELGEIIQSFVQEALGFIRAIFGGDSTEAIQQVFIQIISTVLLFLVVKYFFWNKVTDYLEGRKQVMSEEYDSAKQANQEAQLVKEQAESELLEIRQGAKGFYDEAKERGENERKEIVSKAKTDAKRLIDNAHREIDSEIEKAKASINDEIVSVATLMAEKIIKKEIDPKKHKQIIDEVTKEVAN